MIIRIMASNIHDVYFGNPVRPRAPLLTTVFERYDSDVPGLQETDGNWWKRPLFTMLMKKYTLAATETGVKSNHVPLFYRSSQFDLLKSGFSLCVGISDRVKILRQYMVTDTKTLDASDHSPVFADVEICFRRRYHEKAFGKECDHAKRISKLAVDIRQS